MPPKQVALSCRQCLDVGQQVTVVIHVEQQLAGRPIVLRSTMAVAHGKLGRALLGFDAESEQAELQLDAVDRENAPKKGATGQRL